MRHTGHPIPTAPVFEAVDADGIEDKYLSELLSLDVSYVSKLRKRETMPFSLADRILIAVGCEHHWHVHPVLAGYYAPPAPKRVPRGPRPKSAEPTHEDRLAARRLAARARRERAAA